MIWGAGSKTLPTGVKGISSRIVTRLDARQAPSRAGDEVPCGVMIENVATLKHDKGDRQLPCINVRPTDSRGDRDRWMSKESVFDRRRVNVVCSPDDYVLSSSSDIDRPVASQTEIPPASHPAQGSMVAPSSL